VDNYTNFERYVILESHRQVYKEIGGNAPLDPELYDLWRSSFGLEVVLDAIAAVEPKGRNRPITESSGSLKHAADFW